MGLWFSNMPLGYLLFYYSTFLIYIHHIISGHEKIYLFGLGIVGDVNMDVQQSGN
jgi:hypothetical protein